MTHTPRSHALILEGDNEARLQKAALSCAAAWLCPAAHPPDSGVLREACGHCPVCRKVFGGGHTDVHPIGTDPGEAVKVDAIRSLRRSLGLQPVEGRWNCAIVFRAETFTIAAANALLTVLEEPPPGTRIILCTNKADKLLPTLRSRCTLHRLRGQATDEMKESYLEQARAWIAAMDDPWERTVISYSWDKPDRDALRGRLNALLCCLGGALRHNSSKPLWNACDLARDALDALERNASAGIVCGLLAGRELTDS